jgi:hypothetical protein
VTPDDPDQWLAARLTSEASDDPMPQDEQSCAELRTLLSIHTWAERDIPEPDRLLGDLLTTTTRAFLVGRTGLGKTLLALAIAVGVASGQGFLHWLSARPARVLYLDGEMPAELIKQRARDAIRRLGEVTIPLGNLLMFGRDIEGEARRLFPSLPPFAALNQFARMFERHGTGVSPARLPLRPGHALLPRFQHFRPVFRVRVVQRKSPRDQWAIACYNWGYAVAHRIAERLAGILQTVRKVFTRSACFMRPTTTANRRADALRFYDKTVAR